MMPIRRGDNIPPISDYAHWNEDQYYMWYEENKYDMEHADEIIEDDDRYDDYEMDEDVYEEFGSYEAALKYFDVKTASCENLNLSNPRYEGGKYTVHGTSKKYYDEQVKRINEHRNKVRRGYYGR